MKKLLVVIMIPVIILSLIAMAKLGPYGVKDALKSSETQPKAIQPISKEVEEELSGEVEKKAIALNFVPQPTNNLAVLSFDEKWKLLDAKVVNNVAGVEQILVNSYQVDESETKLVLQDRQGFYDLGISIEGEPDRVTVLVKDMNNDGAEELVLIANQGTTYMEVTIYTFDGENWRCLLATENLISIDLNNDGQAEMVTTSMGSLPGYIWIYRWNGREFEKSDIVADMGSTYAAIITFDGRTAIEAGTENNPRYYEYVEGSLVELAQ